MKDNHSENKYTQELPPLEIIDLDAPDTADKIEISPQPSSDKKDSPIHLFFEKYIFKINWHIVLLLVLLVSVLLIVYRFYTWGTDVESEYDPNNMSADYEIEVHDNILPLLYTGDEIVDDGVRTIVAFGNSPFADDKVSDNSLAALIQDSTDAVVYDCSVADTYLSASALIYDAHTNPMDAFSFYWLATLACVDVTGNFEAAFESMGNDTPADARYAYETLVNLDFNTVDVITIMYDASDYLAGRPLINHENGTDITTFYGNLNAGIQLIQDTYPHIRIIVMSPTYAYAIDENGEYVSSDLYLYSDYSLSYYVAMMETLSANYGTSYLDHFYGTVNELNADQYLEDHLHLNLEGRQKLAERFIYALEYYDE